MNQRARVGEVRLRDLALDHTVDDEQQTRRQQIRPPGDDQQEAPKRRVNAVPPDPEPFGNEGEQVVTPDLCESHQSLAYRFRGDEAPKVPKAGSRS